MTDSYTTLTILGVTAILLCTELIPIAVTSMMLIVALILSGVLSPAEAFAGFSNSIIILLAGTFVVAGAIFHTGLAQQISSFILRLAGKSRVGVTLGVMTTTAGLSAILSNTGTTGVLLPVVLSLSKTLSFTKGQLLLALAFSANLGGTLTLIGTTPNLIAAAALTDVGLESFSFFEFAKIGAPLTILGMLFMITVAPRLASNKMRISTSELKEETTSKALDETVNRDTPPVCKFKIWLTSGILIGIVIAMAGGWTSLSVVALVAAITVVLTRCITYSQALRSIDWTTILLIAGMLALATALEKTGTAMMIAQSVLALFGPSAINNPYLLVGVFFTLTWLLTQFMANTASSALLIPIGLSITQMLGISPKPILMTIAIAASCAFATPVATPPNTIVYSAGQLRFLTFVRVGFPLSLFTLLICLFLIPLLWSFSA